MREELIRQLAAAIEKADQSDLMDGGRYFVEHLSDLTRCRHGDTGEYRHGPNGKLVELLWNNRRVFLDTLRHVAPLVVERDEADRQAGALMRENAELKDSASRRADWLRKAKKEAGYSDSVSFDVVWQETLAKARNAAPLVEAAQQILLHAGIADAAPEDIDGEDHARASRLRSALAPFQQEAR